MPEFFQVAAALEPGFALEGAGVLLQRSFSPRVTNLYDPFLLFDHFAFNDPIEAAGVGFPMHPHRGIETVTYMLAGKVDHRDSLGNRGQIGPGDVQWMTAGSGILHEEMPRIGPDRAVNGFQLWVNLPAARKMTRPHYQGLTASDIPSVDGKGWQARVIAGRIGKVHGPGIGIAAHAMYMDVSMQPGSKFNLPVPSSRRLMAYMFEGQGDIRNQAVSAVHMLVLEGGDTFQACTREHPMRFMLLAGEPIQEQIAPYGPFVMNTPEEIQQALLDLENGTFVKE